MKTLIVTLIALTSANAFARQPAMPSTAKLLFQVTGFASSATAENSSADSFLNMAVRRAEVNIENRIKGEPEQLGGMFGSSGERTNPINVEYECKALYRVWAEPSVTTRNYARGGFFDGTGTSISASITVNVYCAPRDFRQKVAISAMQACEKEPKVECMSKEYMDAFSKIEQTNYYDTNKP